MVPLAAPVPPDDAGAAAPVEHLGPRRRARVAGCVLVPRHVPAPVRGTAATPGDPASFARFPPFPVNLTGTFEKNERLAQHAVRLFEGRVDGAESVAVAPDGTLVMLDKYGYIHRARKKDSEYHLLPTAEAPPLYIGPGRPLGFHVVEQGKVVLVCDSLKGLLRVELASGAITVLSNSVDWVGGASGPSQGAAHGINYANDLDVAEDGTIYFTSSTAGVVAQHPDGFYDTMRSFLLNMCAADHTGRLLKRDRATGRTSEVMTGLWYANGVALAHDGESVLVVETMGFRVLQHWLSGPKAGQTDTLIEKLPGFLDGITRSADGNYWLCLVAPLSPLVKLLPMGTAMRYALSHLITSSISKHCTLQSKCPKYFGIFD